MFSFSFHHCCYPKSGETIILQENAHENFMFLYENKKRTDLGGNVQVISSPLDHKCLNFFAKK